MKGKISPIVALWILITITMAIFIGISFSDDINIGDYTLTKARFPETLVKQPEKVEIPIEDSITDSIPMIEEPEVKTDTTVHKVLIFGDSMTHNLAINIARYGTKNNYKVTGVTWESSSMPGWEKSGKIKKYMEMVKPDFVIIALGSNETGLRNFDLRIPVVKSIINQIGDVPFIWAGPPLWKKDSGIYPMLEKTLPPGSLFKAENIDIQRAGDHIHPTLKGARTWADSLMRWMPKSYHPILSELPDSGTTTTGHQFIYLHPND